MEAWVSRGTDGVIEVANWLLDGSGLCGGELRTCRYTIEYSEGARGISIVHVEFVVWSGVAGAVVRRGRLLWEAFAAGDAIAHDGGSGHEGYAFFAVDGKPVDGCA